MASNYVADVCTSTGTYVKDGEEKKRWLKVGAVFKNEHGNLSIKLEALPIAKSDGVWLSVFPRDNQQQQQQQQPKPQTAKPPVVQQAAEAFNGAVVSDPEAEQLPF